MSGVSRKAGGNAFVSMGFEDKPSRLNTFEPGTPGAAASLWRGERVPARVEFTAGDRFAPLRPVDGKVPEVLQWLPGQECDEPADRRGGLLPGSAAGAGSIGAFSEYDFANSWIHGPELVSRRTAADDSPQARLIDGT